MAIAPVYETADRRGAPPRHLRRLDLTSRLLSLLDDEAVVAGIGNTSFDLFGAGHRPQNFYDFNYVENGPFAATHLGQQINIYQWRFLPLYQLYIVAGALAGLYLDQLRAFVRRHGRLVVAGMALGLAALWGRYAVAIGLQHRSQDFATTG